MAKGLHKFLIWAIEGINNLVSYFEHDLKRGNARKTVAIALVVLAVAGLSFVGTGVTGQVIRAQQSAADLSSKLGDTETKYQQLSVKYDDLQTKSTQCSSTLDQTSNNYSTCKTDLSTKTTLYDVKNAQYNNCMSDYATLKTTSDACATSLSNKTTQLNDKTAAYTTLNTNYNNLVTKNTAIIVNAVYDYCNCPVRTPGSTINYQITASNHIVCFVPDADKTGTVTC